MTWMKKPLYIELLHVLKYCRLVIWKVKLYTELYYSQALNTLFIKPMVNVILDYYLYTTSY